MKSVHKLLFLLVFITINSLLNAQENLTLKIDLKGIYESQMTLMPLVGADAFKPIIKMDGMKSGKTTTHIIPKEHIPGEFLLQFNYKKDRNSNPERSEKKIFISFENLELRANPAYISNNDSTYFLENEKENTVFAAFSNESQNRKEKLAVLQHFLMNYNDSQSAIYKRVLKEYEKKRKNYNLWITKQTETHKDLFVSRIFSFNYIPSISFNDGEDERIKNIIINYFTAINLKDSLIIKTSDLGEWMNSYVNMHGALIKNPESRDSLLVQAGIKAIEEAKKGHPLVYGWMVDYFFRGYEANGIDEGMKILEQYINDPNCLTSKKVEIIKRLNALQNFTTGATAPDILMKDKSGNNFQLSQLNKNGKKLLLLFWAANCNHCVETINVLYPLSMREDIKEKLDIVAIGLDEYDDEINIWNLLVNKMEGWTHLHAKEGVNSQVANDYGILSTPVMFLLESDKRTIAATPFTLEQLKAELDKN